MYNSHQGVLDALRAAPEVFEVLLHECTQERASTARGGDEGWSVVEVICHLRDAEERALERMRSMRDTFDPLLAAYDQERWAQERNYAATDLCEALAAFIRFRAQHVAELAALPPQEWDRAGQHAEQGRITISSHSLPNQRGKAPVFQAGDESAVPSLGLALGLGWGGTVDNVRCNIVSCLHDT